MTFLLDYVAALSILKFTTIVFAVLFVLPVAAALAWWSQVDRPANWRAAEWGASGVLPAPSGHSGASIHVMAARTGGLKGALSVHSWLVIKDAGSSRYERFDKVGWGSPVRQNAYAADAFWYSNRPVIVAAIEGERAEALIPQVRAAIASYPYDSRGDYGIWPGPNSNTFVAHVLRTVPEMGVVLPPNAVGKDYLGDRIVFVDRLGRDIHVSLWGLAGFSGGVRSGAEIHFLGQTFGFDFARPAIKLPGIGRFGV